MSKLKSIWYGGRAAASICGAIGTATGHGLIHVVAVALRVRIPPQILKEVAKYQVKSAEEHWEKAEKEWDK